ncbi:hypothetical protein F4556_006158 [Kitasatospora gansuensis]|uniref:Uncharacterized protein n=1 Tax=Kitasatospora gansuensis TaxID=258050 RepID=A0A7W7WKV9_9ACTN|nr:hypothetical protein [Kitasatospora gansuensis]MBB4950623.1 hypothetical protein [Kitasatospora gansuensis]
MNRAVRAVLNAIHRIDRIGGERARYHDSEQHRRPPDRIAVAARHYRSPGIQGAWFGGRGYGGSC